MFTVYFEKTTGEILAITGGLAYDEATKDCPTIETGVFPTPVSNYYVLNGSLQERPEITPFAGSPLVFSNLPNGAIIRVENEVGDFVEATKEDEAITLSDAGVYKIRVSPPFPYKELEQELVV